MLVGRGGKVAGTLKKGGKLFTVFNLFGALIIFYFNLILIIKNQIGAEAWK